MTKMEYKYHFIYKITNKINNKFYIGAHSTNNIEDGYMGSGKMINKAIDKYGLENFKKDILEYCDDQESLFKRESEIVTKELVKDKQCYNIQVGGRHFSTKGFTTAIDKEGNRLWVPVEKFHNSNEYVGIMKGRVSVRLNDGTIKSISKEEFDNNKENYLSINKGYVCVKLNDGNYKRIKSNDFDPNSKEYTAMFKGTIIVSDKNGKHFRTSIDDPKIKSGEYQYLTKGRGVYKDKDGNIICAKIDDPRVLSGELVGHTKGYKWTDEQKERRKNKNYISKSIGKIGITKNRINKFIYKSELSSYIENGWKIGMVQNNPPKKMMNKDGIQKLILIEDQEKYLKDGWQLGGLKKEKGNRIYIHKPGESINLHILKEELEKYLKNGYVVGRIMKDQHGMVHVHNKKLNKGSFIEKKDLEKYLKEGWELGMLKSKK